MGALPAGGDDAAMKIFIVDDSKPIRSRLAAMVRAMEGVELVGEAVNARDAMMGITGLAPHSVLLDLGLPDGSGMDVLRKLHPIHPGIAFIVLTNHSEPQYRRACERAGAAYFLDKSTEFDKVPQIVRQIAATRH